jgi:hypothetical protein
MFVGCWDSGSDGVASQACSLARPRHFHAYAIAAASSIVVRSRGRSGDRGVVIGVGWGGMGVRDCVVFWKCVFVCVLEYVSSTSEASTTTTTAIFQGWKRHTMPCHTTTPSPPPAPTPPAPTTPCAAPRRTTATLTPPPAQRHNRASDYYPLSFVTIPVRIVRIRWEGGRAMLCLGLDRWV